MNTTGDLNICWGLLPSWTPADLPLSPDPHNDCPQLETYRYIKKTVPCPPPTKPCLFWAAANNSILSSGDIQLVTSVCGIPNISECSNYPRLNPSLIEESLCTPVCLALVVSLSLLLIGVPLVIVGYCSFKGRKRSPSESCCTGVCICVDRVVIRKTGLNRSESCSPAMAESWSKPEINVTGLSNDGYVNEEVLLDWQMERVEYCNSEDKDLDSGIVPNAELKPDESMEENGDVFSETPPSSRCGNHDLSTQNILSDC
ncbi:uncharacterized protein LOC135467644 [Liolophura sinensis]|uniref:uncharacterized protein LOC135467644 n=1 Tax=Liolophura sinensis TaxID=3198878 RepID=UPI0031586D3C